MEHDCKFCTSAKAIQTTILCIYTSQCKFNLYNRRLLPIKTNTVYTLNESMLTIMKELKNEELKLFPDHNKKDRFDFEGNVINTF